MIGMWLAQVGLPTQTVAPGLATLINSANTLKAPLPPGVCATATRLSANTLWSAPKVT